MAGCECLTAPASGTASVVYLTTHTQDEGSDFFRIVPDPKRRRAVRTAKAKAKPARHLRVV